MKSGNEFAAEARAQLTGKLIPFWQGIRDQEYGGYYGWLGYDLSLDRRAVKGCILNSRILWFFSSAYVLLGEEALRREADHAWAFLRDYCVDRENGGVYWSVAFDGEPEDTTKHTYNQAFAIYALSAYYEASGEKEALKLAWELFHIIEEKCRDEYGYLEAFNLRFEPEENDKLSENGVMAEKTMNTLLHVFEAYTELYRVTGGAGDAAEGGAAGGSGRTGKAGQTETSDRIMLARQLRYMLDLFTDKVYNPALGRQEVFFDRKWNSLIDLHSYGHDIETAWLVDRGLEVLGDEEYKRKLDPITRRLTETVYRQAYRNHSLENESEKGVTDTTRVWWVQAEAVVGFLNGWQKEPEKEEYRQAAEDIWAFIMEKLVDPRPGSEWFWALDQEGNPLKKPIVEPWKCPYHNGRMCMEVIRRMKNVT